MHKEAQGSLKLQGRVWNVVWWVPDLDDQGRPKPSRRSKRIGTLDDFPTKEQAEIAKREFMSSRSTTASTNMTLASFIDGIFKPEHIERCVKGRPTIKQAGKLHYDNLFNRHLVPFFGTTPMNRINSASIQKFLNMKLDRNYSVQTCLHLRNALHKMFVIAKAKGLHKGDNPTQAVELPTNEAEERPALTLRQAQQFLDLLWIGQQTGNHPKSPSYLMALLGICTSVGRAELLGLKYSALSLDSETIVEDKQHVYPGSLLVCRNFYAGVLDTPKTKNRRRLIELAQPILKLLRQHRAAAQWSAPDDYVFCSATRGVPAHHRNIEERCFKPAARAMGLDWVPSFHTFRRTFISLAGELHFPFAHIQAVCGHAARNMTMRYARSDAEQRRRYLEKLAAVVMDAAGVQSAAAGVQDADMAQPINWSDLSDGQPSLEMPPNVDGWE